MMISNHPCKWEHLSNLSLNDQHPTQYPFRQYLLSTILSKIPPIILFLFYCGVLFSCGPNLEYYKQLNVYLRNQEFDAAHRVVRENKKTYPGRNDVLYYLDEGIVAHYASRYEESNQSFSRAESIMEDLYTKSLSREATSYMINDNTVAYGGEDFENALVNLFMALNYVALGRWDDALVEARKMDDKLNVINSQYKEGEKNVYKEDAFIRFLMGALYEAQGEINDAFISYRKAVQIYRTDYLPNYGVSPPPFLIENLMTSAQEMGFGAELTEIKNQYPNIAPMNPSQKKEMAAVYVIFYNGLGPEKREAFFFVPMPDGYVMKIAYPRFEKKSYQISGGKIAFENSKSGRSYRSSTLLMEDIGSIAVTNLKNRIFRIKAKAIARATAKYIATEEAAKAAGKQGGQLASILVKATGQAFSFVSEQADIRHWRLLPDEIQVGRVIIPSGTYKGEIRFVNSAGGTYSSKKIAPFTVGRGEKRFFLFRTLD